MNINIRRTGSILIVLMLILMAGVTAQQFFLAASTSARPEYNTRTLHKFYDYDRGPILVEADPAAISVPDKDNKYLRTYSNGAVYAPATGYYSSLYGSTGIEKAENQTLSGNGITFIEQITRIITGERQKGGGVVLTLSPAAQKAAYKGMGNKVGSVTAIDPSTGAILAMVSTPSYDPNKLTGFDLTSVENEYNKLINNPFEPLLDRALASTPAPGSTFKLVTAAAALASGNYTMDSELPAPATYKLPGSSSTLPNWQKGTCNPDGSETVTLKQALAVSCNTAFAWLGDQLGQKALLEQAEKFGFNTKFSVPMRAASSNYPTDQLTGAQTAMSAMGQGSVTATTLQMAMVTGAIGNGGTVMVPYLVKETTNENGNVLQTTSPVEFGKAMSEEDAQSELEMMVNVVQKGTGSNAQIDGITVGGKTGTAESGNSKPASAWFVAVAPTNEPKIAVAVCVEYDKAAAEISGNAMAAPIAREVIKAYLAAQKVK